MKRQIAPLIAGLSLAATALTPFNILGAGQHHSGVAGEVFISDCVVVHPGENCYQPYQTILTVESHSGHFVTNVTTDAQGRFEVFLKPGNYVLIHHGGQPAIGSFPSVAVHVEQRQITPVTILYDSGIL
jgi:hypothetical protein